MPHEDGYDYSQHIVQDNSGGEVVAVFSAIPNVRPEPDHDYKIGEMTEEQKEVFLALNDEAEYEELEDDFVNLA